MKKILVIRRDNIGDLVCTTPLLISLRQAFPDAWIGVLANAYNAPVLEGHPAINALMVYTKLKHRRRGQSALGVMWDTWRMVRQLKRLALDIVILASPGEQASAFKYARWVKARQILAYDNPGFAALAGRDAAILESNGVVDQRYQKTQLRLLPMKDAAQGHECEATHRLISLLGVTTPVPAVHIYAGPDAVGRVARYFRQPVVGTYRLMVHISARKPSQRWELERWVQFLQQAHQQLDVAIYLLWAPGAASDPLHPGDDEKAAKIIQAMGRITVHPVPTKSLHTLMGALAHADLVVCADGGAMHIAAGLGKPLVCLFGKSNKDRWHPFGVPHVALQPPSEHIMDIPAQAVVDGLLSLYPAIGRRTSAP